MPGCYTLVAVTVETLGFLGRVAKNGWEVGLGSETFMVLPGLTVRLPVLPRYVQGIRLRARKLVDGMLPLWIFQVVWVEVEHICEKLAIANARV